MVKSMFTDNDSSIELAWEVRSLNDKHRKT